MSRPLASWVILVVTAGGIATSAYGQQNRADLLASLNSSDESAWGQALEQLRSDPVALSDPKIKTALLNLLERDNREPVHGEEEGYAEDRSWLGETVTRIVDWGDPRQVCILANSVALPDELADHPKVSVPCLLRRLKSGPNRYAPGRDISRGDVVAMLIRARAKAGDSLDLVAQRSIQEVVLNALRSSIPELKVPAVQALGDFGGADMIPALMVVAKSDPNPSEHYAIRRWAAEAIAKIQTRTGQH